MRRKYSLVVRKNGRKFRYCFDDEALEVISKNIYGETVVTDWMNMGIKDWKHRNVRKLYLEAFSTELDNKDFGRRFNVVMN